MEEFKNVPAGQTQLDIFHILLFKHAQLLVQVNPTEELHCADPLAHVAPNDKVLLKIIVPNFFSNYSNGKYIEKLTSTIDGIPCIESIA